MQKIDGHSLTLRLVQPQDAGYIFALRSDPRYNAHLSEITGDVESQRAWINAYKLREADGSEYYYVIERRLDGKACGVVRIYDVFSGSFTWGSWILDSNKPKKAALESAVLVYRLGFEGMGLQMSAFDVRNDNRHTLDFHLRFGAQETGRDAANTYFELTHNDFFARLEGHEKIIRDAE